MYIMSADGDNPVHVFFCGRCSSALFDVVPRLEDFAAVLVGSVERVGTVDKNGEVSWDEVEKVGLDWFVPQAQYFCRRRLSWLGSGASGVGIESKELENA